MAYIRRGFNRSSITFCLLFIVQSSWTSPALGAESGDLASDLTLVGARISEHRRTGLTRFIGTEPGFPAQLKQAPASGASKDFGLAFASKYGASFGIANASEELLLTKNTPRATGGSTLRYQQVYLGVPIFAGEIIINLNADNALLSMNGEISPELSLSVTPTLTTNAARETALLAVAKWKSVDVSELQTSEPLLSIYDAQLLKPSALEPSLVWRIEVSSKQLAPIRELILIDAHTGSINLHFNQVHMAKNRQTHDGGGTDTLPGTLICEEGEPFPGCAAADTDVINAHDYAGDTYDFYSTKHGRDGIDGAGGLITSTVHWDDGGSCPNAFWNGAQMIYCDGLADADDVVGHELTHGVTTNESNLLYYYQSGAINESLSDIGGEFVDLTNGKGDDDPSVRWLLGEDLTSIGAIRDMQTPGTFGDPDRMSSGSYWTEAGDNGGVHINSGINNKAAYLMTDGDTFNSITVTGLGLDKNGGDLLRGTDQFADLRCGLCRPP